MSQNAFSSIEHDWNEPLPLPQGPPLLPWPENIFQEPFELYVKELARSTEVPVELPAMLVLATVAAITQSIFEVEVREDYCEPTNLWVEAMKYYQTTQFPSDHPMREIFEENPRLQERILQS